MFYGSAKIRDFATGMLFNFVVSPASSFLKFGTSRSMSLSVLQRTPSINHPCYGIR